MNVTRASGRGRDGNSGSGIGIGRENLQTFTVWKIHKAQIQAPIHRVPSLSLRPPIFLSLIPSPQFSSLPSFVFANYLSSLVSSPLPSISSLSTQSVNPRRNVPSSIAIPVRSSSAAKWAATTTTTTAAAKGLVKSISMAWPGTW